MTTRLRHPSTRRRLLAAAIFAILTSGVAAVGVFAGEDGPAADRPALSEKLAAVGPDVVVFSVSGAGNYGVSGGHVAYSLGTTSCNRGDQPLNWCDQSTGCAPGATSHDHPVIAQNVYQLYNGRFQQVGMSWLKHGFVSTNSTTGGCTGASGSSCTPPPAGGNQLGVGCTDPYGSSLNGSRPLGPRSEVNATTGAYPFPYGNVGFSQSYEQRIKVLTADVDGATHPGAVYWGEAQYIAPDDALAGNGLNNASYRPVTIGSAPNYLMTAIGSTVEQLPAVYAWRTADPAVAINNVDVALAGQPFERFQVARKVTDIGAGVWHYEYTLRNHNSDRAARSFAVIFPAATTFSNAGFHDIDAHSGEPYDTTDWAMAATEDRIAWSTDTFAFDQNANALRWATMFNFWFDADRPPEAVSHQLDMFKPGEPAVVHLPNIYDLFGNGFETGGFHAWSARN